MPEIEVCPGINPGDTITSRRQEADTRKYTPGGMGVNVGGAMFPPLFPLSEPGLRRDDAPLRTGYSDEQVKRWVQVIRSRCPKEAAEASELVLHAAGDCLGAAVLKYDRTGKSSHYSRKKSRYGRYTRYGYQVAMKAMALLDGVGLVDHSLGTWFNSCEGGNESWFTPLPDVRELILGVTDRGARANPYPETIIVKDHHGKFLDYADTPATMAMSRDMARINEKVTAQVVYDKTGSQLAPRAEYRQFRDDPDTGGRFVATYQNTSAADRLLWEYVWGGQRVGAAEADITGTFPALCYAIAGLRQPQGDPYQIPGLPRQVGKLAFNTMLFAKSAMTARASISHEISENRRGTRQLCGLPDSPYIGLACDDLADRAIKAIAAKHWMIKDFFYQGRWGQLQKLESDIANDIRVTMIDRTGWCPRAIHDSFNVPAPLLGDLVTVMREVMAGYGIAHPEVKTKGGDETKGGDDGGGLRLAPPPPGQKVLSPPPPPPSTRMGVTPADLHLSNTPSQEKAALVEAVLAVVASWREASAAEKLAKQRRRRAGAQKAAQTRAQRRAQRAEFLECQP